MRPKDLTYLELNEMSDLLTITDRRKAPGSQPQEMVGVTLARPGFVLNRDFGTTNRFDSYPSSLSLRSAAVVFHQDRDEYWTLAVGIAENGDTEIWGFAPPLGMWGKLEPLPDEFEPNNGENPHIRWLVTDSITKFVVIIGDNYPLSIQWHDERTLYDDVIPEGWYAELHQLEPTFVEVGSTVEGSPAGDLSWDSKSYHYGSISHEKEHVLTNNGLEAISVTNVTLDTGTLECDPNTDQFEFVGTPETSFTLQPGDSRTFTVVMNQCPTDDILVEWSAPLTAVTAEFNAVKELKGSFWESNP